MGHSQPVLGRSSIMAAVLLSLSSHSQAAPVNTIFAAENSLYGRGYDIGRADGWMDDALHRAISRFQSRTKGLRASGNLDPATLKALGVSAGEGTISGNALASQQAARAALELTVLPAATTATAPAPAASDPVASAAPEPAPSPATPRTENAVSGPEPVAVAKQTAPATSQSRAPTPDRTPSAPPQRETTAPTMDEPDVAVLKTPDESGTSRTTAANRAAHKTPAAAVPQPARAVAAVAPDPESTDTPAESATATDNHQPQPVARNPATPAEAEAANSTVDPAKTVAVVDAPAEKPGAKPTVNAPDTASQPTGETSAGSSGGFFSWLFDLLFGWMA